MAVYSGTPTVVRAWQEGDQTGKIIRSVRILELALTAQGDATDNISATALGFKAGSLERAICILFTDGSSNKRHVDCFTDGTYLYVSTPTQATDANRGLPGTVTGTLRVEVAGQPVGQ